MENELIKNDTSVFYTVQVKEGLFARRAEFGNGRVLKIDVTDDIKKAFMYTSKEAVIKVAEYTNGTIIKHTRTEIITEVTEKFKEDLNND